MSSLARRVRFAGHRALLAIDPSPALVLLLTTRKPVPMTVASVYRARNAAILHAVLEPAERSGADIRLWALDEAEPSLSRWTRGEGPGGRFQLLNRLLAGAADGHVVVVDDDVVFTRGNIVRAVQLSHHLGLNLAQPSHELRSKTSYDITRARLASAARRTNFVEIGPVVIAAAEIRGALLPFSEETPMGWAVDTEWTDLEATGHSFDILDAVRVKHIGVVGSGYEDDVAAVEREALLRAASERGLDPKSWRRTLATVRPWTFLRWHSGAYDRSGKCSRN